MDVGILVFALLVLLVVGMIVWALQRNEIVAQPFNNMIIIIVVIIGAIIIANRAGIF